MKRVAGTLLVLALASFATTSCGPRLDHLEGLYVMQQPWGTDSLRLFADSTYSQHFTARGDELRAHGRWRLSRIDRGPFGSAILVQGGLYTEDNERGEPRIRREDHGFVFFGLSWFWFDRSLQKGEDAPTYRRVR